ncbi:hypothetical protein E2C01_072305 [Portunus trituberculatus]|uniref:Uncharacterized protein n=1 Tax=Portunus trituberculatus TaxID=210409 RepID=A0A5B7I8K7_PORTR|nr:hypothetical protein [Portunus trituberculatus]
MIFAQKKVKCVDHGSFTFWAANLNETEMAQGFSPRLADTQGNSSNSTSQTAAAKSRERERLSFTGHIRSFSLHEDR